MPTNPNMVAIQTVTVGSGGAANIEFTNIPQTYTDLIIKLSARVSTAADWDDLKIAINGSTTDSEYTWRALYGYSGSTVGSNTATNNTNARLQGSASANNATGSTFGSWEMYIPNYAGSNNKSVSTDYVTENNSTATIMGLATNLRTVTAAITSFRILTSSGSNFAQHSTATLYGVTSAAYGAKATGGIISSDANYYYHTFLASGTFTPTQSLSCDYLVVAGAGGGGAAYGGGGGGAGGYKSGSLAVTGSTNYTVTIGAGGAGSPNQTNNGSNGSNSIFSSITSTGGGGGSQTGGGSGSGSNGGSGGGGAGGNNDRSGGGTASPSGEGNNGGTGSYNNAGNFGAGGGGGGASASGGNGTSSTTAVGGNGGNGTASSISGSSITYAGGGGGGAFTTGESFTRSSGGSGGGGAGGDGNNASGNAAVAGTANTGGGGGGGGFDQVGAAGGSGIVIVRYSK